MSALGRLGNYTIYQFHLEEICGRQAKSRGCEGCLSGIPPDNSGTTFWRDYAVIRVLKHVDTVSDAERKGAAASTLADNHGNDGAEKARHFTEIVGNGFG